MAVSCPVGSLGPWAGGFASDEPCILDAMREAIFHDGIVPVDESGNAVFSPDEVLEKIGRIVKCL